MCLNAQRRKCVFSWWSPVAESDANRRVRGKKRFLRYAYAISEMLVPDALCFPAVRMFVSACLPKVCERLEALEEFHHAFNFGVTYLDR